MMLSTRAFQAIGCHQYMLPFSPRVAVAVVAFGPSFVPQSFQRNRVEIEQGRENRPPSLPQRRPILAIQVLAKPFKPELRRALVVGISSDYEPADLARSQVVSGDLLSYLKPAFHLRRLVAPEICDTSARSVDPRVLKPFASAYRRMLLAERIFQKTDVGKSLSKFRQIEVSPIHCSFR